MKENASQKSVGVVVVAAGRGVRAGGDIPKQWRPLAGKTVVHHSLSIFATHPRVREIIVVVHPDDLRSEIWPNDLPTRVVPGGSTRSQSVLAGLRGLSEDTDLVLIHDAARPDLPFAVIERLVTALDDHAGSIPVLPVVDSLAIASEEETMEGSAARETLRRVQTPQAFRYADILAAHRAWEGSTDAGDDAQVLAASSGSAPYQK